jgi:hypothetical protein
VARYVDGRASDYKMAPSDTNFINHGQYGVRHCTVHLFVRTC